MTVVTPQGTWVVPPHRAIWVPAGVEHGVQMSGRVAVRTLFLHRDITGRRMQHTSHAINVPPLLRELIQHVCRVGILRRGVPADERIAGVVLDQLCSLPSVPLQLPLPSDPRARLAAETLIRMPSDPHAMRVAVRRAGASRRTLERLFVAETNMTLGRWCQRMRLIEALRLLAKGNSVTEVAFDVGYKSSSAFIASFRSELGTTPARYFGTTI